MSQKWYLACVSMLLGLLLSVNSYAEPVDAYLQFGISSQGFSYKEFDDKNALLDREGGLLTGLAVEFGRDWQSISAALRFELFDGVVDYDGQTQAGIPLTTRTNERIATYEALLRFKVKPLAQHDLSVIVGLGYRDWRRNIRATNTTASLFEVYRWKYFSLGGAAILWRRGRWSGGIDARWLRPIRPGISVNIAGFDEVSLRLEARNSARVNIPFHMNTMGEGSWTLTPYWESWHLGRSGKKRLMVRGVPTSLMVSEPRSETHILGITLSIQLAP